MTLKSADFALKAYTVPISLERDAPLPGHQAPLDKRHRWAYQRTDAAGHWYRCRVCKRRKRVVDVVMLLARRMRDAQRATDDYLNETLFR